MAYDIRACAYSFFALSLGLLGSSCIHLAEQPEKLLLINFPVIFKRKDFFDPQPAQRNAN